MSRATNAPASRRKKKRLFKKVKGYWGDRKNHIRLASDAVIRAMVNNYQHRKKKKSDFRTLWITRIGIASKFHGISYSKFIDGLKKAGCSLNRKALSELAIHDPKAFAAVAERAKSALTEG